MTRNDNEGFEFVKEGGMLMSHHRLNLLSIHEAIDMLGVSRSTFDRWRKQKQLPFTKLGKEILIDKAELERWIKHHSSGIAQPAFVSGMNPAVNLQEPRTITVGYQSGYAHVWTALIMKELGWFEEELSVISSERIGQVKWVDAANGPELVKGMIGGHVQIASLGDYPIALSSSLAQLLPAFQSVLLAFDGKSPHGHGISLVVRKGIQIRDASDISGLKLSTVAQSSSGYRLSKLMNAVGGSHNQIMHQAMDASMSGIAQRQIEGSVMTEPYLSLVQYHGTGQVFFQEGLGEDYLTGIVAEESWAGQNRPIIVAYLKAHIRVHELMRKEPAKAAKIIARIKGIPGEVVTRVLGKIRWDAALYRKDIGTLKVLKQENARVEGGLFVNNGEIKYSSEYLNQAIKSLNLPLPDDSLLAGEWGQEQLY